MSNSKAENLEIILIRHGQSEGNVDFNKYLQQHDATLNLTDLGVKQAEETGLFLNEYLKEHEWDDFRVFSSSYDRAIQTQKAIVSQFDENLKPHKIKYDDRLRECEFGDLDGIKDHKFEELFPEFNEQRTRDLNSQASYFTRRPRGESPADVGSRCKNFFGALIRDQEKYGVNKFIIVCHGITLRAFMKEFLYSGDFRWYSSQHNPKNASVYHIKSRNSIKGLGLKDYEGCVFIPESAK